MPGALISDRTALENRPASDGSILLIADHNRVSARAFLENMRPSRACGGVARALSKRQIEERLDETHAFTDPNEADAAGIRLMLPAPEILGGVT